MSNTFPSVERVYTCHGINLPDCFKAVTAACSIPPQQGTSIRTTVHSLAGMLKKHYEKTAVFQSSFTLLAIQNSISLFDEYNRIRNNKSYAHDNDVLGIAEAEFAVKMMANLITFIDRAEAIQRKIKEKPVVADDDDLPF